jgi:hypothetical protein
VQGHRESRSQLTAKPVLSTLEAPGDPYWNSLVEVMPAEMSLRSWLRDFRHLARGKRAFILRGTVNASDRYRDILAAIMLRATRRRVPVIISDATIEPGSRTIADQLPRVLRPVVPLMSRLLIRAADGPHVTWCVLSTAELESFPTAWRVPRKRVVYTPFKHTLWGGGENEPTSDDGYLFSGGNSLRDYDLLRDALDGVDVDVRIASGWTPSNGRVTSNRVQLGLVSHEAFLTSLRNCHAVVLPLQHSTRSTGQQTFLNAMVLRKPVIVTRAPGVLDYIRPGLTGVVVDPEPAALRAAIAHILDPANAAEYREMGERARVDVLDRFSENVYRRRLLGLALEIASDESQSAPA